MACGKKILILESSVYIHFPVVQSRWKIPHSLTAFWMCLSLTQLKMAKRTCGTLYYPPLATLQSSSFGCLQGSVYPRILLL